MKILNLWIRRYSSKILEKLLRDMPKDLSEHIQTNQKHRLRIREKSRFYSPGTVNIQVLGSGARGTSSCVYIFSEQSRYLFNCGEGTQRLAHEHHTKLTRMEHIFLTQKSWGKFGGVPGLSLTLQEIGLPQITLHGPSGISDIFQSIRRFVVLKDMKVNTPECLEGGFFEDSVMRVNYVPLFKEKKKTEEKSSETSEILDWAQDSCLSKDDTDYYGYEKKGESSNANRSQSPTLNSSVKSLDEHVMAYICKLQPKPGHLNLEACVERGVKPGPLLGRLKNGFDVTLPDGSIVKADDVRGPCCPGPVYIFVDVPDESYVSALLACECFKQHQKGAEIEDDRALVVIHFSPEEMMTNLKYREWMDRFPSTTNHLFVNERNTFTGFFATHRIQRQLHELTPQVFPMLKEPHPYMITKSDMAVDISELEEDESPEKKFKFDTEGDLMEEEKKKKFDEFPELGVRTTFHLRPPTGFDRNKEPYNHPETVMDETYINSPELPELISDFKAKAEQIVKTRSVAERNKEFPRVLLLGTGSMIPNKTRNVSANLVHFSPESCGLFDCGEGTLGQIVRFYGRDGADEVLKKLKLIYISHLHADHHLGLLNILNRRRKITNDKVLLVAPHQISVWLTFYSNQIDEIFSTYELVSCTDFMNWDLEDEQIKQYLERMGLEDLKVCFVKHCPHAFGVTVTMKNLMVSAENPSPTVKITYSGDTMPCESLINIGKNSDILIHEATMEDDLKKEARAKLHSTVSEAIEVGQKMNARFVILTHFSQRYARIPLLMKNHPNVAIGFDNMEVTLNDLPMMHLMYEPLKCMFADHYELIESKNFRRKTIEDKKIIVNQPLGNGKNKKMRFEGLSQDTM